MALSVVAQSASAATGSTSLNISIPAHNAGDLLVAYVGVKPDVNPSDLDDWMRITRISGGGGTTGAGTGPSTTGLYWRYGDGVMSSVPVTISSGNSCIGMVFVIRSDLAGAGYEMDGTTGTDITTGSSWSVTASTDPGFTTGDLVLVGSTTGTTLASYASHAITATGATFGSLTELAEPSSTLNNDVEGFLAWGLCTGGTSSAAPVYTATASGTTTNVRGTTCILRVREVPRQIRFIAAESQSNAAGSQVGDLTVDVPTGTQDGDLMVAAVYKAAVSSQSLNAPSGWTLVDSVDTTNIFAGMWYRIASSEPASYTWGVNVNGTWGVTQATFRGASAGNPIHTFNSADTNADDPATFPSVTTTNYTYLLLYFAYRFSTVVDPDAAIVSASDTSGHFHEISNIGEDGNSFTRGALYAMSGRLAPGTYNAYTGNVAPNGLTDGITFSVALNIGDSGQLVVDRQAIVRSHNW